MKEGRQIIFKKTFPTCIKFDIIKSTMNDIFLKTIEGRRLRIVLRGVGVRPDHHVRVDVHRRPLPAQPDHSDGLSTGHIPQIVSGPRLGHPRDPDGHLGNCHRFSTDHLRVSSF